MPIWRGAAYAAALLILGLGQTPAQAQSNVDLQLVLAVDASGSVDTYRFELQRRGYVQAFRNPRVLQAVRGGASLDRRHHDAMDRATPSSHGGALDDPEG